MDGDVRGKPPFGNRPPGPLSHATGLRDDVVQVVGPCRPAHVAKGGMQLVGGVGAKGRVRTVHANRSVAVAVAVAGSSFSSATLMRIASRARFRRDLAV